MSSTLASAGKHDNLSRDADNWTSSWDGKGSSFSSSSNDRSELPNGRHVRHTCFCPLHHCSLAPLSDRFYHAVFCCGLTAAAWWFSLPFIYLFT